MARKPSLPAATARGKTSIADAIAFAVTGQPFFGERGIDKLHNEIDPDVSVTMNFLDEEGTAHTLTRTRRKNRMVITYDGYEIRQLDLTDMFGERDVFLSIFNPLYFIEELGDDGKNLLEMYLPMIPHESVLGQLSEPVRAALEGEEILSPDTFLGSGGYGHESEYQAGGSKCRPHHAEGSAAGQTVEVHQIHMGPSL